MAWNRWPQCPWARSSLCLQAGQILSAMNIAAESEGMVGKPALPESREEPLQLLPTMMTPSIHWYLLIIFSWFCDMNAAVPIAALVTPGLGIKGGYCSIAFPCTHLSHILVCIVHNYTSIWAYSPRLLPFRKWNLKVLREREGWAHPTLRRANCSEFMELDSPEDCKQLQ